MENIKLVGISASPRHANTEEMVKEALEASRINKFITTEFISLAGKKIHGCTNCRACIKTGKCVLKDDWEEMIKPLINPIPDGVIFGAPVYFYSMNSQARAYLERCTSLFKSQNFIEAKSIPPNWNQTVAGVVTVGYDRNGGQEHTMSTALHFFLSTGFVVVGVGHFGYIGAPGWLMGDSTKTSVRNDISIGMPAARIIGRRVAETAIIHKMGYSAVSSLLRECKDD
jgi:multimeric flavodoxin WrbA